MSESERHNPSVEIVSNVALSVDKLVTSTLAHFSDDAPETVMTSDDARTCLLRLRAEVDIGIAHLDRLMKGENETELIEMILDKLAKTTMTSVMTPPVKKEDLT